MRSNRLQPGALVVEIRNPFSLAGGRVRFAISIDGRAAWSWSETMGARTQRIPIVLDGNARDIVISAASTTQASGALFVQTANARALVGFEPKACSAELYADGCTDSTISFPQPRVLDIRGRGSITNGVGFSLIGFRTARVATPFVGCFVGLDAQIAIAPYTTDASGTWSHTIPLPRGIPLRFLLQDAQITSTLRTGRVTGAYDVACR